jgi:RNA polymerase sigma-70 factor (ECF subfamily)
MSPPSDRQGDEVLMERYRSSADPAALSELLQRYGPELTGYLRRIAGSSAADDLLQLVFLHVHQKRASYQPGRRVRPWLYSIATHLAIDWLRREGRHSAVSIDREIDLQRDGETPHALSEYLRSRGPASGEDEGEEADSVAWARRAVEELPAELRAAVMLVFLQGESYAEAAEVLGIPVGTVKSRVHRALRRLRREVAEGHDHKAKGAGDL